MESLLNNGHDANAIAGAATVRTDDAREARAGMGLAASETTSPFLTDTGPLQIRNAACAIILLDDGRYLLQLRDDIPGIFFPGHWGLFGGALENDEDVEEGLRRELNEELGLVVTEPRFLMRIRIDPPGLGLPPFDRDVFLVKLPSAEQDNLVLREGAAMKAFSQDEVLALSPVIPYDAFCLWLHISRARFGASDATGTSREG